MNIKTIKRYLSIWLRYGQLAFQVSFVNRGTILFFFVGKVVRYTMTLLLLWQLSRNVQGAGGYSIEQLTVFFLVYQVVDTLAQMLFRGVYEFSYKIKSGDFDFDLCKPIHPLFRALMGSPDVNDLLFFIPTLALNLYIFSSLSLNITLSSVFLFLLLLLNTFMIAVAFHIIVLAIGILMVEIESVVWMYRDFARLSQLPANLYGSVLQFILFVVIPVGLMVTIPSQVLLGMTPTVGIGATIVIGAASVGIALLLWRHALRQYTSASS